MSGFEDSLRPRRRTIQDTAVHDPRPKFGRVSGLALFAAAVLAGGVVKTGMLTLSLATATASEAELTLRRERR
jgi:hypothetical protein